jgi:hypothetical protein
VTIPRKDVYHDTDRGPVRTETCTDVAGDRGTRAELQPTNLVGCRHPNIYFVQSSHLKVTHFSQDLVSASSNVDWAHDLCVLHKPKRVIAVVCIEGFPIEVANAAPDRRQFAVLKLQPFFHIGWRIND